LGCQLLPDCCRLFSFSSSPPLSPTITFLSHPVVNGDCPWPSRPHVKRERQPRRLPPGLCARTNPPQSLLDLFQGFCDPSGCTCRPSTLASCPLSRRRDHQCNYHHHHHHRRNPYTHTHLFFSLFYWRQSVGVSTAPGLLPAFLFLFIPLSLSHHHLLLTTGRKWGLPLAQPPAR